jgi:hypothetical protein
VICSGEDHDPLANANRGWTDERAPRVIEVSYWGPGLAILLVMLLPSVRADLR